MSEFPSNWGTARLAELTLHVGSGATPKGGESSYKSSGVPLVRSMNVVFFGFKFDGLAYIDDMQAKALGNAIVKAGDVLLNITGASIGRVTRAPAEMDGARVNQHVCIVRPVDEFNGRLLQAYLSSPRMQSKIWADNYGVTRQALTKQQILDFEVPVPPLAEQHRIADKLDSVLARVDAVNNRLARVAPMLKRFRQTVLSAATSGRLTTDCSFDDWNESPVEALCRHIGDGPFGSNLKSDDYSVDGVRVVRLENIGHLFFVRDKQTFIPQEKYEQLIKHTLQPGDLLFSSFVDEEVRVCQFPGDLGVNAINKADCFCVRVDDALCDPRFLMMRLASRETYELLKDAVHGATRPRINLKQLRSLMIRLPSRPEQAEIVRRVDLLFAFADRLEARLQTAQTAASRLTPALLAKAFRGELVQQDPNDEPASELLRRLTQAKSAAPTKGRKRQAA